jgi:lactoylglutathione lyase
MTKISQIIFYVADQNRSKLFYETILQQKPVLDVEGMTEFMLSENFKLGLMPEKGISKILLPYTRDPASGNGIPRCELYLIVDDPREYLNRALKAGALKISDAKARDWGDEVAYCADLDGNVIAFAR